MRVKESSVFSRKYYTEVTQISTLSVFEIEIWCYRGGDQIPKWIDRKSGKKFHIELKLNNPHRHLQSSSDVFVSYKPIFPN